MCKDVDTFNTLRLPIIKLYFTPYATRIYGDAKLSAIAYTCWSVRVVTRHSMPEKRHSLHYVSLTLHYRLQLQCTFVLL